MEVSHIKLSGSLNPKGESMEKRLGSRVGLPELVLEADDFLHRVVHTLAGPLHLVNLPLQLLLL
jgi:hypothetical protein